MLPGFTQERSRMMKQWILGALMSAGLALIVVASWAAHSATAVRPTQSSPFVPPLDVGKTYGFGVGGTDLICRVLQEPRDGWVQVESQEGDSTVVVWLYLQQVSYIMPNPTQKKKGCAAPCRPDSV
jgi:hypothetical protein